MARLIGLTLAVWLISRSLSWAAPDSSDDSTPPVALEEVVVTARRVSGLAAKTQEWPASVSVITDADIARSGARTTLDVLQQLAGVSIMDNRGLGLGADSGVNLRGLVNSSRTGALVLVDGIRQNRITGDEVHWVSIPVTQIERIEVIRGGGGTIYGEGALAGVVSIITKRGAARPLVAEESLEGGSFGWWRALTQLRGTEGPFAYGLSVTRQLWDGYRDSTSSRASTAHLATTWTLAKGTRVDVTARYHDDTSHFAGGLTPAQVEQDRRNQGNFPGFFHDEISDVGITLTQSLGQQWTLAGNCSQRQWNSNSVTTATFANLASSRGAGVRLAHHALHPAWEATTVVGGELLDEKAITGTRMATFPVGGSESNKHGGAGFLDETVKLFSRWVMTGGFRYDHSDYQESLTFPAFEGKLRFSGRSPKVGVTYLVNDQASLYASWAQSFKAPNIDDLDAVLPPYNDNVSVRPQTARTAELGLKVQAAPWLRVDATGFVTRLHDEILFNAATFANANYETRRTGLELAARGTACRDRLSYGATYTFVRARFVTGDFTGYVIPGTPEHRVTLNATYRVTPWLEGAADALWVDVPFRINNFTNTLPGDSYGVVNATLRYARPRHKASAPARHPCLPGRQAAGGGRPDHEVFLTVQNLFDEEYTGFQSSNGTAVATGENPAPPRTFLVGARMTW